MKIVSTPDAPTPRGHYSQGIVHDGLVYVAGQVPVDPKSGEPVGGDIEQQTTQALRNMEAVLKAAGSSRERVLKVTVHIPDAGLWAGMNAAYARFFGDHRPARTAVPSRDLSRGMLVEVDAVAAVG